MPRRVVPTMTTATMEDDALYTIASVNADPDAADLISMTSNWLPSIAAQRQVELKARMVAIQVDANRIVANGRLDAACVAFGNDLGMAVDWDYDSPRWRQFFPVPVSRFVRKRLALQTTTVLGWVESSHDPVFEKHKARLEVWAKRAEESLQETASLALVRGEALTGREQLAEDLTAERDGLRDALSEQARRRGLPRTWPNLFFRTGKGEGVGEAEEEESTEEEPTEPERP